MIKIWRGIFWKIVSCACFAGINALVRYLSAGSPLFVEQALPIYMIMLFQNIIGLFFLSTWMIQKKGRLKSIIITSKPGLHILRVITAATGIGLWYKSIQHIPITEVVALSFAAPIITVIGSIIFLREKFSWQRKVAVSLSIIGGFLMVRPDRTIYAMQNFNSYMLFPLIAAFVFAFDKLLTRKLLSSGESTEGLTWYLILFLGPICIIPICMYGWVTPCASHIPWLVIIGILGTLAHYAFNKAYELADVVVLLPFGVAKLLFCALLSYIAFAEIPSSLDMWLGILVITFSTIILGIPNNIKRYRRHGIRFYI